MANYSVAELATMGDADPWLLTFLESHTFLGACEPLRVRSSQGCLYIAWAGQRSSEDGGLCLLSISLAQPTKAGCRAPWSPRMMAGVSHVEPKVQKTCQPGFKKWQ